MRTVRGRKQGFSLVETLVVLAIVSVLMALYMPALSKAMRAAEKVAGQEAMHQQRVGRMADTANSSNVKNPAPTRDECRQAFRQNIGKGSARTNDVYVTEMRYVVQDEGAFRAYYFTLIDPSATEPLRYDGQGNLLARDDQGHEYALAPMDFWRSAGAVTAPIYWEFLSTNLAETSSGDIGTTVAFSDSHTEYIRYPGPFPACRSVAELSHRFFVETQGQ